MSETILVVDDEPEIRSLFERYLTSEGFRVLAVPDGATMRHTLETEAVDLIILDLGLPREDGLSLLRYLREASQIPVIIVTGKGDPIDRVVGLEVGADDYIVKPFLNRELLARAKAVLRRTKGVPGEAAPAAPTGGPIEILAFNGWRVDVTGRRLSSPTGEDIRLTSAEFDLLLALVRNAGRPMSRDQLLETVHGRDWSPIDRSIDVHVANLRRKIEDNPRQPTVIITIRNIGYALGATVTRG
jgi:DNA-binding response OmpR family regulator